MDAMSYREEDDCEHEERSESNRQRMSALDNQPGEGATNERNTPQKDHTNEQAISTHGCEGVWKAIKRVVQATSATTRT